MDGKGGRERVVHHAEMVGLENIHLVCAYFLWNGGANRDNGLQIP